MAGPAPQQPPITATPYGDQQPMPAMPAYDPRMGKRPGSTATKVWGIILLILGGLGVLNLLSVVAMLFGGFGGSRFAVGLNDDAKREMDRLTQELIDAAISRPTYWLHLGSEVGVVALSIVAGTYLVIRPRPLGAKLALARVALVILTLPVYGYETMEMMDSAMSSQQEMVRLQMESDRKAGRAPSQEVQEMMGTMGSIVKGGTYAGVVLSLVGIIVINAALGFQMSRPHIKEYLASVQGEKDVIPGYDPSMGLMMPPPGQAPPGAMPAGPRPQQGPPPGA